MRVEDVMTHDVATVQPDTPLRDVARLLVSGRSPESSTCDPS
jgi:CBS domain-containing protein